MGQLGTPVDVALQRAQCYSPPQGFCNIDVLLPGTTMGCDRFQAVLRDVVRFLPGNLHQRVLLTG